MLWKSIDKMKENGFKLTQERHRRYLVQTITDVNFADDIAFLSNAPAQVETVLHSLEWASAGIGLHINAHKTEYMCFNQTGDISRLNGSSLKHIDKFTYLESNVSSTKTNINTRLTKSIDSYWYAIGHLEVRPDRSCWYCYINALHGR